MSAHRTVRLTDVQLSAVLDAIRSQFLELEHQALAGASVTRKGMVLSRAHDALMASIPPPPPIMLRRVNDDDEYYDDEY